MVPCHMPRRPCVPHSVRVCVSARMRCVCTRLHCEVGCIRRSLAVCISPRPVADDHLRACARWPWCIRDDAPMIDLGEPPSLTVVVRWRSVVTSIVLSPEATSRQAAAAAFAAVTAVITEDVVAPLEPVVLKVREVEAPGRFRVSLRCSRSCLQCTPLLVRRSCRSCVSGCCV